jgi:methionyl-tRNA formyltransferase
VRVIFFGTPAFAVPSLSALAASSHTVVAVVTQPDRPRGRGQRVVASPVKERAVELGLTVLQPDRLKDEGFLTPLRELAPDLGVVAAYGKILPTSLLQLPRFGMINVHASLLPRWRGAAPIHRAVIAGDTETGITIMRVVPALDAGPMLARFATPIAADDTSDALEARLASIGADLLMETVHALARGPVTETPQDEARVTYASRLDRRDSSLDWNQPAIDAHNRIRGLHPWPLAAALWQGKRVMLLRATPLSDEPHSAEPGTVLRVEADALVIATSPGALRLVAVQLEGRPPVSVAAFLNGHRVTAGDRFDRWMPPVAQP